MLVSKTLLLVRTINSMGGISEKKPFVFDLERQIHKLESNVRKFSIFSVRGEKVCKMKIQFLEKKLMQVHKKHRHNEKNLFSLFFAFSFHAMGKINTLFCGQNVLFQNILLLTVLICMRSRKKQSTSNKNLSLNSKNTIYKNF